MAEPCTVCSECPGDISCREYFDLCQAREFSEPAYFAVHHISVPCYYLQHNLYSKDGWLATRERLSAFLATEHPPGPARDPDRTRFSSANRRFRFTRGDKLAGVETIRWSITIADIRLDTPELYCAGVSTWGRSILADSEDLVRPART